jgi:hypothetical protein
MRLILSSIGATSRYIQYRADLATTVSSATPVLQDVHISCSTAPDVTPPVISNVAATPGAGATAVIGWSTRWGGGSTANIINQGKFSPGAHIPIRPYEEFRARYPDYALLFGWNHAKEIMANEREFTARGGKWIVYVPEVKVLE